MDEWGQTPLEAVGVPAGPRTVERGDWGVPSLQEHGGLHFSPLPNPLCLYSLLKLEKRGTVLTE